MNTPQPRSRFRRAVSSSSVAMVLMLCSFAIVQISSSNEVAAQHKDGHDHAGHNHDHPPRTIDSVSEADLFQASELSDVFIGNADAKITIIEYASITCGACGNFHRKLLPEVKKKYIDTGIARLIVREFPLENVAAAAAMIARCTGEKNTYKAVETMFNRQQQWLRGDDVREGLLAIAKEHGLSEKGFDECLANKGLLKKIAAVRNRAHKEFGVKSTPTFFINGKGLVGPRTIADFDKIIEPMLQQKQ